VLKFALIARIITITIDKCGLCETLAISGKLALLQNSRCCCIQPAASVTVNV
jgi:hypothetical protein